MSYNIILKKQYHTVENLECLFDSNLSSKPMSMKVLKKVSVKVKCSISL